MAEIKISGLPPMGSPVSRSDLLALVDVSDVSTKPTGKTKRPTVDQVAAAIVTFLPYRFERAIYTGKTLDLSALGLFAAHFVSPDETRLFVLRANDDTIYQFTMSTPGDLDTAVSDGGFSVSAQEITPLGFTFNAAGTRLYVCGSNGDAIFQYNIAPGDAWDIITNAPASQGSASVAGQQTAPHGLLLSPDGTKMLVSGTASGACHQYTLATPGEVIGGSMSYATLTFSDTIRGMAWAPAHDGTPGGFLVYVKSSTIIRRKLNTPFSLSGSAADTTPAYAIGETSARDVKFVGDGHKMWVGGISEDSIHEYYTSAAVPAA